MSMDLLLAMLKNMNMSSSIELNFHFTANNQTYKIKANTRDQIQQFLYRFSENQPELNNMIIFSVTFNGQKCDIANSLKDIGVKEGDTIIVESEMASKEIEASTKKYIKPYPGTNPGLLIGTYEGELKNGNPDGKGRFFHILGGYYEGDWKDGKKEGFGIDKMKNMAMNEVYEGEFKDDKRNGKGTLTLGDGEVYEGDWVNDKKDGKGKTTYPNGDTYEGDFKNGLGNGRGIIKWTNGNKYEGEMKDDLMSGKGVLTYDNGDIYEGEFVKDSKNGKGVFKWVHGDIFEGDFKNGSRCGKGIYKWKDGRYYEGDWKNDQKNGKGIFKFCNGDVYEGDFVDDSLDGFGKMTYADGRVEEGLWEDNKYIKDNNNDYKYYLECIKIIDCKNQNIRNLLKLKDGRLLSTFGDGTINIYNKDSYEVELSIKLHSDIILKCIQLSDGKIATCSKDQTIKIIELLNDKEYKISHTLESENSFEFQFIEIKNNELVSLSDDETMKVWDLNTLKITKIIPNKSDRILKLNENEFVTSSLEDKCLKFWNLNYENTKTINDIEVGDYGEPLCLYDEDTLLATGLSNFYSVDLKNYQISYKTEIIERFVSINKCLDGNLLCSAFNFNENNHIFKFSFDKKNLTKIFEKRKTHKKPIYNCFEFNNGNIVSAGEDIKIWEIKEKSK